MRVCVYACMRVRLLTCMRVWAYVHGSVRLVERALAASQEQWMSLEDKYKCVPGTMFAIKQDVHQAVSSYTYFYTHTCVHTHAACTDMYFSLSWHAMPPTHAGMLTSDVLPHIFMHARFRY